MSDDEVTEPTPEDVPDNPFTEANVGFIQLHEMFRSMKASGFSEYQAAVIIGTIIGQASGNGD